MRQQMREVIEGARDSMLELRDIIGEGQGLTDEELAVRYANQHRGNPMAIMSFVRESAPPDTDALKAAVEYERTMEALWRERNRR